MSEDLTRLYEALQTLAEYGVTSVSLPEEVYYSLQEVPKSSRYLHITSRGTYCGALRLIRIVDVLGEEPPT